jgi:isopentenyl-diphosphate delta-isomerase
MAEMLDVVDQSDNVVGQADRKECHKNFLRHRAVQIFVFDPAGSIFVQKRSRKKDVFPGLYEVSCSGHVHAGEAYTQAAVRELAEELGVTHREHELKELFTLKLSAKPEHEFIKQYILRCECVGRLQKEEVESGEFIAWEDLLVRVTSDPTQFTPATVAAIERYETLDYKER